MDLPIVTRSMELVAENPVDLDKRTVRMSFSSEVPILRRIEDKVYYERLSHETSAILSDRLENRSVPFLDNHNWDKVGGKVIEYNVRADKGYATVKLSRNPIGIEMLNDISDGVRTEISVGYKVEAMRKIGEREGKEEFLVTKWMPYEVSLVGVPADHSVGVGRSSTELHPVLIEGEEPEKVVSEAGVVNSLETTRELIMAEPASTSQAIEVIVENPDKIREAELTRSREILAVGTRFNALKEAEDYVRSGKQLAEFNSFILEHKVNTAPLVRTADPFVGTSPKEAVRYNLAKAILEGHEHLSGFEREMSQEIGHQVGRQPSGMFVPEFALMPVLPYSSGAGMRAGDLMATGGATIGGNLIQTTVDTTLVPFLRAKMVTGRMGCTMFTGLTGNFALPRQTSTATATWNSENNDPARSGQTFDQVVFQPQRLSAVTAFSKWLLQQAQIDTQTVVRDDLLETVAHANDSAALYGTGINNQPVGIFATTADTVWPSAYTKTSPSVTFGSGYPTWSKVVQFEGNIESNNIDLDNASCGYVVSPNVKTLWKTMAKVDPRATNQFYPSFIWEDGPGGGAEGRVNGFKALATNQITNDKVVFGKWSDLVIAQWGGIDLLTDPYTLASSFQIRIIINLMTDIDFRYGPAFCYSTDTGLFK
jgi:HK97 family phage major capsid protein/HK97 family phage prohead protease